MTPLCNQKRASQRQQENHAREQQFLMRAHAGEDIRDDVLIFMQSPLASMARRFHWRYSQQQGNVIEATDLVNSANAEILAHFTLALTKEQPFPYLYRIASRTMLNSLNSRGRIVKAHPDDGEITILSLDRPLCADGTSLADLLPETMSAKPAKQLHIGQALAQLPEIQRIVIQRHFGLFGHAPESLNQVSRILSPRSPRPANAHRYYKLALLTLRQLLSSEFVSARCTAGGSR